MLTLDFTPSTRAQTQIAQPGVTQVPGPGEFERNGDVTTVRAAISVLGRALDHYSTGRLGVPELNSAGIQREGAHLSLLALMGQQWIKLALCG